ncbi:MAG: pimeloyl-ACP methyl esterase BioG family protein [Ruegeria sp.]
MLTLVFGGWALGPAPFAPLTGSGDFLVVDDYRSLDDALPEAGDYDGVRLLAYSFGVASAGHWLSDSGLNCTRKVAVNGTLTPADAERGIAPETVAATADGLTVASFARFCRRAGVEGPTPQLEIAAAADELRAIAARGPAPDPGFDRIWISQNDRIVPTSAQNAAWADSKMAVQYISGPHQPFRPGQSWGEWFT